ncbi:hypothetical protein [Chlorobaculum parvum]|uniref:hypothetical protein n=1 Tax=Chlorobaculum parvum TaxID=274539 RepID=UPI00059B8824|nr:hypothetical protein [Chlorobaculum parvum]
MKTEVKIAIIGGIVTIIVALITGGFDWLNSSKSEPVPAKPPVSAQTAPSTPPASQSVQGNSGDVTIINGDNNIKAGGDVTIQGEKE